MEAWKEELYHYGTKGMHWGTRHWQNSDGTFNESGKQRYFGKGSGENYHPIKKSSSSINKAGANNSERNKKIAKAVGIGLLAAGTVAATAIYVKNHPEMIAKVGQMVKNSTTKVSDISKSTINSGKSFANKVINGGKTAVNKTSNAVKSTINTTKSVAAATSDAARKTVSTVKDTADKTVKTAKRTAETAKDVADKTVKTVKKVADTTSKVVKTTSDTAKKVSNVTKNTANSVKKAVKNGTTKDVKKSLTKAGLTLYKIKKSSDSSKSSGRIKVDKKIIRQYKKEHPNTKMTDAQIMQIYYGRR